MPNLLITPNTPYDTGMLPPTDLKISTASKGGVFNGGFEVGTGNQADVAGWIGSENYGWYFQLNTGTSTASFDTSVIYSGKQSLKIAPAANVLTFISNTDPNNSTGAVTLHRYVIPVKGSTTYVLSCWAKFNAGVGLKLNAWQYTVSNGVYSYSAGSNVTDSTAGDWRLIKNTFTTGSTIVGIAIYLGFTSDAASQIAYFDDIKLEEVVTDTTFTGKTSEKVRPVLTAVTSTDNIDQSLDSGGAYANTYAIPAAIDEGATNRQTFTPTKKYTTQIGIWPVAAGTSVDWTITVHDASNVVLASKKILAASIATGAMQYWDVPFIWTTGALHFHVTVSATTGTPTCKANTSNDLETASYIQRYAKKSETYSIVANGIKTEMKADKDGLLTGAIIDLDNGKYRYQPVLTTVAGANAYANDIFSATAGGQTATPSLVNGWYFTAAQPEMQANIGATERYYVLKVNTLLPVKHFKSMVYCYSGAPGQAFDISPDNVTWTNLLTMATAQSRTNITVETDVVNGLNTFYVRWYKSAAINDYLSAGIKSIEVDLDTSKIPTGLFYPIATNQFTETVTLNAVATRAYFRLAKFTNEYGVVVPAIEFTDTTPTTIGYIPLKLDNSQETNPSVRILSTTTNYQASGTGSDSGGYILNDGEYMTFTSTTATIKIDYQVGAGTTSFSNITKNTVYYSSNGEGNDSTQDPSHQMSVDLGIRQQGVLQRQQDLSDEIELLRKHPILEYGELVASGTNYALTTTLAVLNFGTTGNLETLLPNVGIYEVTAEIHDDYSAVTATAALNYSLYWLYVDSVALTNGERLGNQTSVTVAAIVGQNADTIMMKWLVSSNRTGTLVSVYGKKLGATTGAWNVISDATGRSRLSFKRIG